MAFCGYIGPRVTEDAKLADCARCRSIERKRRAVEKQIRDYVFEQP